MSNTDEAGFRVPLRALWPEVFLVSGVLVLATFVEHYLGGEPLPGAMQLLLSPFFCTVVLLFIWSRFYGVYISARGIRRPFGPCVAWPEISSTRRALPFLLGGFVALAPPHRLVLVPRSIARDRRFRELVRSHVANDHPVARAIAAFDAPPSAGS